jgi:TRAP-type C4-dicarboxylate transport system permease small subunit
MVKWLSGVEKVFTWLSIASVFVMVCLTAADSMGRYFLNLPITGAYEITEKYIMIFAVYFAVAYAYREGANIRVTLLVSRLPAKVTLVLNSVVQIFSTLLIVFLFFCATRMNLSRMGEVIAFSKKLSLPLWPAYLIISLGLLLMSLLMFTDIGQVKRGKSSLFKEEASGEPTMS